MNDFKEWLSDYLRYFLLILAVVLTIALVVIGVRVYQGMTNPTVGDGDSIEILTEKETETVSETEAVTEAELQTETTDEADAAGGENTDDNTAAADEVNADAAASSETSDSAANSNDLTGDSESAANAAALAGIDTTGSDSVSTDTTVSQEPETEVLIVVETEPETEAVYEPVYKTLKGSCYIRSGPSMEAEIIGEYMYGTTVEFLEDVGGWYKVQIDGMVGYMGARFF